MFLAEFPTREEYCKLGKEKGVVPVCMEILADSETPVSLLGRFFRNDRNKDFFLLESVEGGERWGRYSFLGLSAYARVLVYEKHIDIIRDLAPAEKIEHDGDPLPVLRRLMEKFKPAELPQLPRFWGGLVGYFTYESVSFIEKRVPNKLGADKPLAVFMIPRDLIVFDNVKNSLTAMVLTYPEAGEDMNENFDRARRSLAGIIDNIKAAVEPESCQDSGEYELKPVFAEDDYRNIVKLTKEMIIDGEIVQAVLAQPFECPAPKDLIALYRAQRYINPSPYMFFINIGDTALIGSSPETMVRLEGRTATVRPIAGTRPRGRAEQEDRALADEMLKDEKERAEHLMLVDLGRNDLGRVAVTGTVQVTDLMVVERYSHVMHLVSNVNCELLPEMDAFDLFAATFPAGTLSGAPKVRAMEIIAELEKFTRGAYGGAAGYISFNGNMDFAITIRTAIVEGDRLRAIAGAGLVYDSDPEKERQETQNKARSVQKSLELLRNSLSRR